MILSFPGGLFELLAPRDVARLIRVRISTVTPSFHNSDWLKLNFASVADEAGGAGRGKC
jgi:hypothetical protein